MKQSITKIDTDPNDYGDYQWISGFLGISIHTARRWVCEQRIPFIKLANGSLVRFKKSEIATWLDNSRTEAAE